MYQFLTLLVLLSNLCLTHGASQNEQLETLYKQGHTYFMNRQFDEAEIIWRNMIQFVPQLEVLWTNLATTLENKGDYEGAEQIYKESLSKTFLAPEENVYTNYCGLLAKRFLDASMLDFPNDIRLKLMGDAKLICAEARKRHPKAVTAWISSGALYIDLLQYETAINFLEQALKVDPNNQKVHRLIQVT
eukprot:TRINITY_DN5545_c0_g1_i1.p1 TRINITY_DN5545_c0_g1~~TRINITY_DN5545_c0_g1_i1.p1  ORF type:complete len:189 (+),score=18.67 TRINITY_DN5545_c0_g1_i1:4-570(+)